MNDNAEVKQACGSEKEYMPSRTEILRGNDVYFQFLSVGCVIRIGCKSIAFNNVEEAMKEFNDFVKDPQKSWKKWNEIFKQNE